MLPSFNLEGKGEGLLTAHSATTITTIAGQDCARKAAGKGLGEHEGAGDGQSRAARVQ